MKNLTIICFAMVFLNLASITEINAQRAWRVSQFSTASADFTSLAVAISTASHGDTLYVESGSYGNISLNKKLIFYGVGIRPADYDSASLSSIPSSIAILTLFDSCSGSRFEGLTITTVDLARVSAGVVISDLVFKRCEISSNVTFSNFASLSNNPLSVSQVVINACILGGLNLGTHVNSYLSGIMISNCMINSSVQTATTTIGSGNNTGILFVNNIIKSGINTNDAIFQNNIISTSSGGNLTINGSHNTFSNNIWSAASVSNATGSTNNQFNAGNVYGALPANLFVGNVQTINLNAVVLKAGSPAIGAGINGVDCGIFGGTSPAVLPPMPSNPTLYFLEVDAVPSSSQLGIRVKARSGN